MNSQCEPAQSSQPASISAGWNDPPVVELPSAPISASTTYRLKQMRMRPVHPSINPPSSQITWMPNGSATQMPWNSYQVPMPMSQPQPMSYSYAPQNEPTMHIDGYGYASNTWIG